MDNIFTRRLSAYQFIVPLLFTSSMVSATEKPDINQWYQFTFENDVMALVNAVMMVIAMDCLMRGAFAI
jgi:hypothetical protein